MTRSKKSPMSKAQSLPDAELDVLACLWQKGEATAAEIREHLHEYRPMTHGSVLTLLKRLAEKSLVTRKKADKGKAFVYRAVGDADSTPGRLLADLAHRMFGGDRVAMIASLLETGSPTASELKELRKLLDHLRRRKL